MKTEDHSISHLPCPGVCCYTERADIKVHLSWVFAQKSNWYQFINVVTYVHKLCTYVCSHSCTYVCTYVCMYIATIAVYTYVCMYVCMDLYGMNGATLCNLWIATYVVWSVTHCHTILFNGKSMVASPSLPLPLVPRMPLGCPSCVRQAVRGWRSRRRSWWAEEQTLTPGSL